MINNHPVSNAETGEIPDAIELSPLYWIWIEEPFDTVVAGTEQDLKAYKAEGYSVYKLCRCVEKPLNETTFEELRSQYEQLKLHSTN